jgi:hypothetical protein
MQQQCSNIQQHRTNNNQPLRVMKISWHAHCIISSHSQVESCHERQQHIDNEYDNNNHNQDEGFYIIQQSTSGRWQQQYTSNYRSTATIINSPPTSSFDIIHCTQPNQYPTIVLSYLHTFEAAGISWPGIVPENLSREQEKTSQKYVICHNLWQNTRYLKATTIIINIHHQQHTKTTNRTNIINIQQTSSPYYNNNM